jgi:predicted small metal-binding protein
MSEMVKFAAQMDAEVLEGLREHAKETHRTLASVLTEAAAQYLDRARVRPVFREAADEVLHEHRELLERLAR